MSQTSKQCAPVLCFFCSQAMSYWRGRARARRRTSRPACANFQVSHPMPAWARARAQEDVKAGLCELAEAHGADLLLVGHAHPSRLRKTFTTSTASHLAHYAPCPTLIIPYKHLGLEPAASDALPEGDAGALAAAPGSGGGGGAGAGRRASVGRLDSEQGRRASSARLPLLSLRRCAVCGLLARRL